MNLSFWTKFYSLMVVMRIITMNIRFALALILCCSVVHLDAQDQYIVKLNSDTLRGKLQINPLRDNSTTMFFRHEDGSKENIRPIRISYVYYDEETQFRSIPFFNQRIFMQIVKEDRNLSYYHYIHKRDNSIATSKVLAKPDGEVLELSALAFNKQVSDFLSDCPEVNARLEAREYKYKDLDNLIEDYNNCDIQVVSASSQNRNKSEANTIEDANAESAAVIAEKNQDSSQADSKKQQKLGQIDAFRKHLMGLDDFDHTRDVLEWLTDVEDRVRLDSEIPNYLWSSLAAMTTGNEPLQQQASELKKALEN